MNHIPDETQIEQMLEEAAPRNTGRLEKRLTSAPWSTAVVNRRRSFRATALAMVMVTLVFAATPQGYAIAQELLLFFTRTESDSYYSPVSDLTFEETTPFYEECGTSIQPTCSVEQVRSWVDFEVKEPAVLPDGMYFEGATGGPDFIELAYLHTDADRLGAEMSIGIEAIGRPSDVGTGIAAKSAQIEQVQIGDLPGEYYTGGLFQDEYGNVTWHPEEPIATLRWEDNGSTYTLIYISRRYPLAKEDLVRLAESMTLEPVAK